MSTQFKSEYDNETPDQWAVITASDLGELRRRVAEAARTTPKGKMREVAAASRSVVTMIEVAREQGVSQRRLAIQMILQAGLMLGAKTFPARGVGLRVGRGGMRGDDGAADRGEVPGMRTRSAGASSAEL